ncbi:hypothetical protein [Nocardia beijingensis]|uniref:hypothetical protein n=1 Tax=Nocardia beijingensis TaxID=95162 RepID=UPI0008366947|nr:hypothetical protein [Nocardia beijingensis]
MPSQFLEFDQNLLRDPLVDQLLLQRDPAAVVLDADELPLLKQHLRLRLQMAELAEGSVAQAKRRIQDHLDDIDRIEDNLRQQQPPDSPQPQ